MKGSKNIDSKSAAELITRWDTQKEKYTQEKERTNACTHAEEKESEKD